MPNDPHKLIVELRDIFVNNFKLSELNEFAFFLGVNEDIFESPNLPGRARELPEYLERHGQLWKLAEVGPKRRGDIDWAGILGRIGIEETPIPPALAVELENIFNTRFNLTELESLMQALQIGLREVKGGTRTAKAKSLVTYLWHHKMLLDLVMVCVEVRPDIDWMDIISHHEYDFADSPLPGDLGDKLEGIFNTKFDLNELRYLVVALGVDPENIEGNTKQSKVENLTSYLWNHKMLALLADVGSYRRPDIDWLALLTPYALDKYSIPLVLWIELVATLKARFDDEELESLIYGLDIDSENIEGNTLIVKAKNLVAHLWNRQMLVKLVEFGASQRPDIDWPRVLGPYAFLLMPGTHSPTATRDALLALSDMLVAYFSLEELEFLVSALGVDFGSLLGSTKLAKARSLVEYLKRHGLLNRLQAVGPQVRPDLPWGAIISLPLTLGVGVSVEELANAPPSAVVIPQVVSALHDMLMEHFDFPELEELAYALGVDLENITGDSRSDKTVNLVKYLNRHRLMDRLQSVGLQVRPDLPWVAILGPPSMPATGVSLAELVDSTPSLLASYNVVLALHNLLMEHFNLSQLEALTSALGVDYRNIPGNTRSAKTLKLVEYLIDHRLMFRLLRVGSQISPDVPWTTIFDPPPQAPGGGVSMAKLAAAAQVFAELPDFAKQASRKDILNAAGVGHLVDEHDLSGAAAPVSLWVLAQLNDASMAADDQTPLGDLLRYVITLPEVHPNKKMLEDLIAKHRL